MRYGNLQKLSKIAVTNCVRSVGSIEKIIWALVMDADGDINKKEELIWLIQIAVGNM